MIVSEGKTVEFKVCGIDLISTKVHGIKLDGMLFKNLFKSLHKKEVHQSNGEIEALIVYEYAGYHPVKQQSVGHLLLLKNHFGKCIGGSHPNLQEGTSKLIQYATVNRARRKFNLIGVIGLHCIHGSKIQVLFQTTTTLQKNALQSLKEKM